MSAEFALSVLNGVMLGAVGLAASGAGVLYWLNPNMHGESSVGRTCSGTLEEQEAAASEVRTETRQARPTDDKSTVDGPEFFSTYHGHDALLLTKIVHRMRASAPERPVVFLAGDSSLDNKHWLHGDGARPCNGWDDFLSAGSKMPRDVCYWLNYESEQRVQKRQGEPVFALNTAVEESTLDDRKSSLLLQDQVIQKNMTAQDYLVVSVGGNDVALRPTVRTVCNMLALTSAPKWLLNRVGWAPGMGYFVDMFTNRIQQYVEQLVADHKPRAVIVCMIYYPSVVSGGWAEFTLKSLGYNKDPEKLQLVIRLLYKKLAERLPAAIQGTKIIPLPLFEVLDPTNPDDYIERVEPSVQGGRKMANAILDLLDL